MGKEYSHYTTNDFIADEFFQRWVNSPDRETNDFWNKWIANHPAKRDEIMQASAFINHLSFKTDFPSKDNVETSLNRSLKLIDAMEAGVIEMPAKSRVMKKYWWLASALVTGLSVFTLKLFSVDKPATIEIITGINEIKPVVLPDSSVITLNANSSIKYASNIDRIDRREVWLKGEAFFNVKHIETNNKPNSFIVHSDDVNVEVLGTTFNVKKREDIYNVSLNTGSIKIRLNDDEGSTILLNPGDFFQYSTKEKYIVKKRVKPELYSYWKDQKMVLENTSLSEMAALIHDTYGYNTIIKDRDLANEKLSGTIALKDEDAFFQTLSFALNINIIKKDKDLIFQSKTKTK